MDKVKRWEESELSGQPTAEKPTLPDAKKKLAPLSDAGPMQLLKLQNDELREENSGLKARLAKAEDAAKAKPSVVKEVVVVKEEAEGSRVEAEAAKKEVAEVRSSCMFAFACFCGPAQEIAVITRRRRQCL